MRLASARANSIMARDSQSPIPEAADTFAVLTCHAITALGTVPMPRRFVRVKATASGGALRAALTRPPRRGQLHLCDEGRAFVAIDETHEGNRL